MAKKTFQDVVPPQRSIRNVELPSRRMQSSQPVPPAFAQDDSKKFEKKVEMKKIVSEPAPDISPVQQSRPIPPPPRFVPPVSPVPPPVAPPSYTYTYDDEPKKSSRAMLWVACGVLLVAVAFGISAFFKSAKITVTPRNETHAIGSLVGTLVATKDATTGLGFQVVTVTDNAQTQVTASGSQQVNTKATGTIIIYNSGTASQKLIATTRFETSAGLVYRLNAPVTVPGATGSGNKAVPGNVSAQVTADATGTSYNIGLSDFTLPALKGTSKYTTIYARSKTPMTGGFSGTEKSVATSDETSADATLQSQLQTSLTKDITAQIPANFVMYPSDVTYSFAPTVQATSTDATGDNATSAILQKQGTAQAIIFDRTALSQAIVAKVLPDATSSAVIIDNLDTLSFAYATTSTMSASSTTPTTALTVVPGQISFTMLGDAHFVWTLDENSLKSDLLGLTKTQAQALIAGKYPAVQEAWIQTQPFWNTTIPLDAGKVTLTNTLDK